MPAQGKVDPYTGLPAPGNPYMHAPIPFNDSNTLANHAYHAAVNQLRDQRGETLDYYGMGRGGKIDPNNPYGQRQLLERSQSSELGQLYNAQQQSGLVGMPAGYGGTTGLARSQRNQALFSQGQDTAQLLKDFQDRLHSIQTGMAEAKWQKGKDTTSGTLQAIMNAITAGAFTPAAPIGG